MRNSFSWKSLLPSGFLTLAMCAEAVAELPSFAPVVPMFAPVNLNSAAEVQLIVDAAQKAGVDPGLLVRIAAFESNGVNSTAHPGINPKTGKYYSTAYGYGQFLDRSWNEAVNKYGSKYGIAGAGTLTVAQTNESTVRDNKALQAAVLAEFTKDNITRAQSFTGTSPQADFYAMHNLGATGGKEFLTALKANPDARVDSIITNEKVIDGNKGLYGDGSITLQQAYDRMDRKLAQWSKYTVPYYIANPAKYNLQPFAEPGGISLNRAAADALALELDLDSAYADNGRLIFSGQPGKGQYVDAPLFLTSMRLACERSDPYFSLDPDNGKAWSDEGTRASNELWDIIKGDLKLDVADWGKNVPAGLRFHTFSARRDYARQWAAIAQKYSNLRTRLVFKPDWLSQTRFGEILYRGDVLLKELSGGVPTINPQDKSLRALGAGGYVSARWRKASENLLVSVDLGKSTGIGFDGNRFWFDLVPKAKSRMRSPLDDDPIVQQPYVPTTPLGKSLKAELTRLGTQMGRPQEPIRKVSLRGNALDLSQVKPTMFVIGHDNVTGKDVNGDDPFELAVADDVNRRIEQYTVAYKELRELTDIFRLYVAAVAVVNRGSGDEACSSLKDLPLLPSEKVKSPLPGYHPSEMFYTIASYKVNKQGGGYTSWWASSSSHSGGVKASGINLYESAQKVNTPFLETFRSEIVGQRDKENWVGKSGRKYIALLLSAPEQKSAPPQVPSAAPAPNPAKGVKGMLDDQ